MELLTIPPPGWPKAIMWHTPDGPNLYRLSKSRRRWASEFRFYGQKRGVYYARPQGFRGCHYIRLTRTEAEQLIAPEALPKWLRVSEGL